MALVAETKKPTNLKHESRSGEATIIKLALCNAGFLCQRQNLLHADSKSYYWPNVSRYFHCKFRTTYLVFDHTHISLLMQLLKLQCRRGTSLMLAFHYKSSVDAFEIGAFVVKRIKNNYVILWKIEIRLKQKLLMFQLRQQLPATITNCSFYVGFCGISRLGPAFIFLRLFKLAQICIHVTSLHRWNKQRIYRKIFKRIVSLAKHLQAMLTSETLKG